MLIRARDLRCRRTRRTGLCWIFVSRRACTARRSGRHTHHFGTVKRLRKVLKQCFDQGRQQAVLDDQVRGDRWGREELQRDVDDGEVRLLIHQQKVVNDAAIQRHEACAC